MLATFRKTPPNSTLFRKKEVQSNWLRFAILVFFRPKQRSRSQPAVTDGRALRRFHFIKLHLWRYIRFLRFVDVGEHRLAG
jgi:hypothetical protein